jgi:predicted MFS family arabinose efflux permease
MPAGALVGGALAESIGMRATLLAGALGFLLSSLWLVKLTLIHPAEPA